MKAMNGEKIADPGSGYAYVKTILYVFPHLYALIEASAQSVYNKAVLSYKRRNTLAAAQEIALELAFGDVLKALRDDVTRICGELSEEERYLVDYKYFHAQDRECPLFYAERSYYRKQKALVAKMAAKFCACGWTRERFTAAFGGDKLFARVYRAVEEGREREIVKKRAKKTLLFYKPNSSPSSCTVRGDLRAKKTKTDTASAATTAMQTSAI